ncbi:hypothetical protein ACS0TY_027664 [Phlomoides rotata]
MLSNIFDQSYTFENSANLNGFYVRKEPEELDMVHMEMDSFDCGISFFEHATSKNQDLFLDYTPYDKSYGVGKPGLAVPEKKAGPDPFSSASFELLNKYGSRCRRLNGEKLSPPNVTRGMSIDMIIQLAAEKFISSSSQTSYELSMLSHPYPTPILCHSDDDSESVRLVQNLLSCAEKVDRRRYEQARLLLLECERITSPQGSTVQRLVFYFTEALHEKIDRETGWITPNESRNDPIEIIKHADTTMMVAFHKELPISQITKFSGIQAIVDHIGEGRKVHLIDLEIRTGIHITILMQALASRSSDHPVECLKITAVATTSSSKESLVETGRRLESFAASLALNVSFNVIMVQDMLDLNESQFEIDGDEAVAVYAEYTLTHMIGQTSRLEHLMRVLRGLKNLRVMVVAEVEADCNSPVFVDRFVEALVFYGAFFEMMADSFKNDEKSRYIAESTCFSTAIRNMVATEGDERKIRHVRMPVWRSFFERVGFRQTELSMSSVYQANLVPKNFASGNSFTFDEDGKSLIIGWKGTPLSSLSAWN